MPKAAMHKDHRFLGTKYDVRAAGQFRVVQGISEAILIKKLTDLQLGFGILARGRCHHTASLDGADRSLHLMCLSSRFGL
jgi:hypothetical protein